MQEKERKKKVKTLLQKIQKSNSAESLSTYLQELGELGDASTISPLLELYENSPEGSFRKKLEEFFYDIKQQNAAIEFIKYLSKTKKAEVKKMIISVFWQSVLRPEEYLDIFIEEAIKGDQELVIEVLSVVENMNSEFTEEELNNNIQNIQEALEMNNFDELKASLLNELIFELKKRFIEE